MEYKLPCAVVRDLLPSYAEDLTEPETTALIKAHLDSCPDCAARLAAMADGSNAPQVEEKQVDYLKKVRKKSRKRVLIAVLSTILAAILAAGAWLFVIGSPVDPESVFCDGQISVDGKTADFVLCHESSAMVLTRIRIRQEGSLVTVTAREVLTSRLGRLFGAAAARSVSIPLEGVEQISFMGKPIWQDEVLLSRRAGRLWDARTPAVGNASDLGRLANRLYLPNVPFHNRLQTDQRPYGWTWVFEAPLTEDQQQELDKLMVLPLALVQNLGEMTWEDSEGHSHTMTLEEADALVREKTAACNEAHGTDWAVPESVKGYAESVYRVQLLLEILGLERRE